MDKARPANLIAIAILVVWLYGTLVLTERRPGYIITLIGGIIATVVPVIHLRGTGIVNVVKSSGGFFFLWTLFALGVARDIFHHPLGARTVEPTMGPVPGSRRTRTMDANTPAKFANASARLREDDGHSKVKVSCGLEPTNVRALSNARFSKARSWTRCSARVR